MIIHDDGHTNVIASDGLISDTEMQEKSKNFDFKYNSFDFIVTNPPFGSSIKQTEKAYLHQYNFGKKDEDWLALKSVKIKNRDSQSTEVLFIEQCHKFLVEDGYLAIVVPDSILTNSSIQYVRDQIEEMYRIVAVISMPQTAFSATGAGVKSSVLFLRKQKTKETEKISNQKDVLKDKVKTDNEYLETVAKWEKEKKTAIKFLETKAKKENPKAIKKEITAIIKGDKSKIQNTFNDKVKFLKKNCQKNTYPKNKIH